MTSVLDLWRAVDPETSLVSGSVDRLMRPVRGVERTRTAPPHLPPLPEGALLIADAGLADGPSAGLDAFIAAVREAELEPVAIWLLGKRGWTVEAADADIPVLLGSGVPAATMLSCERYLDGEVDQLTSFATAMRLAGAEAALASPEPSAPAGVAASRLRRGVAVTVDGALQALNPRPAGRALATRFAATHARLLSERSGAGSGVRRTRDGLWIMERPIGQHASAWLFDDLPPARIDEVGLEALAVTLRALLRRPAAGPASGRREVRVPPSTGDPVRDTLLAVARANGRVAPAARSLGVHRNTVLYRLRRASADLGIDPRRPDDALRLLRETDDRTPP